MAAQGTEAQKPCQVRREQKAPRVEAAEYRQGKVSRDLF